MELVNSKVMQGRESIAGMSKKLMENKDSLAEEIQKEIPMAKIVKRISELIENRCKGLKRQEP